MFAHDALLALVLGAAGTWLWLRHAAAWGLGTVADVLGYDAAQYAVAARELATQGRLATLFALPIDLARHAPPPWPLSLVQPGLVLVEAALFRIAGVDEPGRLARVVVAPSLACYLATGVLLAWTARRILELRARDTSALERSAAAFVVGLAFLLDPLAQHYAAGGLTEMPFTLGLAAIVMSLGLGAVASPFAFGLMLGVAGLFRGNMLWLAPMLAIAMAFQSSGSRARRAGLALAGYAAVLAPWWIYKSLAFGNPAWDLSALSLWDGIGGRTWFSLNHLPELPEAPPGAFGAVLAKMGRSLPQLLLQLAVGPRTLWMAALVCSAAGFARHRSAEQRDASIVETTTSWALLAVFVASIVVASATDPLLRYVTPARLVAEAAGLLATWALVWRAPGEWSSPRIRRVLAVAIAVLALGWGTLETVRGIREASGAAPERGVPTTVQLQDLSSRLDRELRPGEPVMSNLGPSLAWHARRPVIHLALTPADVEACRRKLPFRAVVLAFRSADRAWPGWVELVDRPDDALHHPEWNVRSVRHWTTPDGFMIVWLDLGPLGSPLASAALR
jgi:hypothetical protein